MVIEISHTNETKGWRLGEAFVEEVDAETPGEVYRLCRREFGRCKSKVYIDGADGKAVHVGWFFEKREEYTDCAETWLRGTWVTALTGHPRTVREFMDLAQLGKEAVGA